MAVQKIKVKMKMGKDKISDNETLDRVYTATNHQELMSAYCEWAGQYENDTVGAFGYVAHIASAQALADAVEDKNSLILDAGCGTGLVGEQLVELGYKNLETLDYSAEMLREAEAKNIYSRHMQADLSKPLDIPANAYDAVICTGTFTYGHVNPDGFDELVRITKPGGTICFTVREGAYEDHGYSERLQKTRVQRDVEAAQQVRHRLFERRENQLQNVCISGLRRIASV